MNLTQGVPLSPVAAVLWVVAGILLSLILPVAVKTLKGAKGTEGLGAAPPTVGQKLAAAWTKYGGNRYLTILFASVAVALVLVFLVGGEFKSAKEAILFGFAWEGLLNKLPK
ncbi:MAG: hypothetical protein M3N54_15955 [Acidobacteriota bacterium]|nr:hypothetical protein [Acidobacteriota bacterium]